MMKTMVTGEGIAKRARKNAKKRLMGQTKWGIGAVRKDRQGDK